MTRMTSPPDDWQRWRPWLPDAMAGLAVLVVGLWEVDHDLQRRLARGDRPPSSSGWPSPSVSRGRAPGSALAIAWCVGGVHVVTGTGPVVAEVLLAYVAFGCARWGSRTIVWLSGLSIPLGATIAVLWLDPNVFYDSLRVAGVEVLARRGVRRHERVAAPRRPARAPRS